MYITATILCAVIFFPYAALSPYLAVLTRSLGFSPGVTGLILGAAEAAAVAGPLGAGALADRRGDYKATLLLVLAAAAFASAAVFAFQVPLLAALLVPVLAAGYRSCVPLSDAVITLNIGRDGNYGKVRATGSISYVAMMLFFHVTPVFRLNNAHNITFWSGILTILTAVVIALLPAAFMRPEAARPFPPQHTAEAAPKGKPGTIWMPSFILGLLLIFLNRLAFSPVQTYIALYTTEFLSWDAVGLVAAVSAASETPFIFLSSRLLRRFKPLQLITFTTAAVALRLLLLAAFPSRATLMATSLLHSCTFGIFHPAAVAFIASSAPPRQRGLGMSLYMALGTGLATFIGNISGGFVIQAAGFRALYAGFSIFAFLGIALHIVFARPGITRPSCV